ncbi:MAG: bacteriohemerythrin [Holophaga sp.]|nr:bacteriohemerythrin [Holophaga sp.]
MALIVWDHRLETGHGKMDEQHESLVEILNRLDGAMKQGKGKDEVGGILILLKDFTVSHFAMEERLMEEHPYAGSARHQQVHAELVAQLADLVDRFEQGRAAMTLPVMNFLEDWLVKHIQEEDLQFARELQGQGSR